MAFLIRRECALIVLLLSVGCGGNELPGGPRLETHSVTGVVQIDGTPTENVEVTCYPDADLSGIKYPVVGVTNKEGVFSLTTYNTGDGLPEGTYSLTFKWFEAVMTLAPPKDLLKGAYTDLNNSQHKITVVKGKETEVGIIELSSIGPDKKSAPTTKDSEKPAP